MLPDFSQWVYVKGRVGINSVIAEKHSGPGWQLVWAAEQGIT